jgi:hypothetical protein
MRAGRLKKFNRAGKIEMKHTLFNPIFGARHAGWRTIGLRCAAVIKLRPGHDRISFRKMICKILSFCQILLDGIPAKYFGTMGIGLKNFKYQD